MGLDELKSAFQTLERRYARQDTLNARLLTEAARTRSQTSLWALRAGQIAQIGFGLALALWAGSFWFDHRDVLHLLLAGTVVHLYGVLNIVFAVLTVLRAAQVDYAAPVLDIQKQIARLRAFYVRSNVALGLAWWLLWLPVTMLGCAELGFDPYAAAPRVLHVGAGISLAGLLLTLAFAAWASDPRHPERAALVRENMAGAGLLRAQRQLDEIARFEQEGAA